MYVTNVKLKSSSQLVQLSLEEADVPLHMSQGDAIKLMKDIAKKLGFKTRFDAAAVR